MCVCVCVTWELYLSTRSCPHAEVLRPWLSEVCPVRTDRIARVHKVIWAFTGRACQRDVSAVIVQMYVLLVSESSNRNDTYYIL